jgi:hypothetical protein
MLKRIALASALALFSIGSGGCDSVPSSPGTAINALSTMPGVFAVVHACEAQIRRMAGLNKTLAANYNAERVHDECVSSTREAVASQ